MHSNYSKIHIILLTPISRFVFVPRIGLHTQKKQGPGRERSAGERNKWLSPWPDQLLPLPTRTSPSNAVSSSGRALPQTARHGVNTGNRILTHILSGSGFVCVCVCVCVRERERERGSKREEEGVGMGLSREWIWGCFFLLIISGVPLCFPASCLTALFKGPQDRSRLSLRTSEGATLAARTGGVCRAWPRPSLGNRQPVVPKACCWHHSFCSAFS